MSKLDRQLDDIKGVKRVEIAWPLSEAAYLEYLRNQLKKEIDSHLDRVPLDLRKVSGTPDALIDLLLEMRHYADLKGKNLVVTHAMPEMREALSPRRGPSGGERRKAEVKPEQDASSYAAEALTTQADPIRQFRFDEPESAEAAKRLESLRRPKLTLSPSLKRFLAIGGLSLLGTLLLVGSYWIYVFVIQEESYDVGRPTATVFESEN